jgi:F-type H+-transporting ATPase subunit b
LFKVPISSSTLAVRNQSNVPTQNSDPKTKAQSLIDSLPGNSLITKTAILSTAAGLSITAISNELYVLNEETVVAFSLLSVFIAIGKYGGPMYGEWANGQVQKIRDILNAARADHTQAVKDRIESVSQMSNVVDITKTLFEVSKVCLIFQAVDVLLPIRFLLYCRRLQN